jgi:hypothetical protein
MRVFAAAVVLVWAGNAASQPADRDAPVVVDLYGEWVSSNELDARLFDLGANVVGAALNGGRLCDADWPLVRQRQAELTRALADATPATGRLVLLHAVTANSLPDVQRLLEGGASRDDPWGTPLHAAARFADPPMLEYLVAHGFGIEEFGGANGPPLFIAASENRLDNVTWLVEHGADVNAANKQGEHPLLVYALMCRDQKLIDYLLAAGAKPDARTREVAARVGLSVGD